MKATSLSAMVMMLLLTCITAHAQNQRTSLSYDYFDAGLRIGDYDGPDSLGLGARFSHKLTSAPAFRFLAGFDYDDIDDPGNDATNLLVGAGLIIPLQADRTDAVVDLGLLHSEIDVDTPFGNADDDDTGIRLAGYLRHQLNPDIQLEGGLNYVDIFEDDDIGINLGFYYDLAKATSLMVRIDHEADREIVTVGARFYY